MIGCGHGLVALYSTGGTLRCPLCPPPSSPAQAFLALWPRLRVLARCSPSDKYMLVMAIKQLRSEGRLQEVRGGRGGGASSNSREGVRAAPLARAALPCSRDPASLCAETSPPPGIA